MSYTNLRKKTEGFTIIEVLIVLAIAGLIMMVVFLAVPALQRNSRNTQRKGDVQAVLASIQETTNNANGQLPATVAAGITNGKYSFYTATEITGQLNRTTAAGNITPADGQIIVNNFSKCPATVPAAGPITTSAGATKRSVTAIYQVETSSGFQNQCVDM